MISNHIIKRISIIMDPFPPIYGNIQRLKDLIESGTNPNKPYGSNGSSLLQAASEGYFDQVKYLVESGANVNFCDLEKYTPLWNAIFETRCYPNDVDKSGQFEIIKYLVSHGADVNHIVHDGMTPFHEAAKIGHMAIVEYLLDNGADRSCKCNSGLDAAGIATENGNYELAQYIRSYTAYVVKDEKIIIKIEL